MNGHRVGRSLNSAETWSTSTQDDERRDDPVARPDGARTGPHAGIAVQQPTGCRRHRVQHPCPRQQVQAIDELGGPGEPLRCNGVETGDREMQAAGQSQQAGAAPDPAPDGPNPAAEGRNAAT